MDVRSSALAYTTQGDTPTVDNLFAGGTAIVISGTVETIPFYVANISSNGQDAFQWRFLEEAPVEEGEEDVPQHGASTPSWQLGETQEYEEEEEEEEEGGVSTPAHTDIFPPQADFPMDHCHRIM
mgnify:CR=1 FL=1